MSNPWKILFCNLLCVAGYTSCAQAKSDCSTCVSACIDRVGCGVCFWCPSSISCSSFDDPGCLQQCDRQAPTWAPSVSFPMTKNPVSSPTSLPTSARPTQNPTISPTIRPTVKSVVSSSPTGRFPLTRQPTPTDRPTKGPNPTKIPLTRFPTSTSYPTTTHTPTASDGTSSFENESTDDGTTTAIIIVVIIIAALVLFVYMNRRNSSNSSSSTSSSSSTGDYSMLECCCEEGASQVGQEAGCIEIFKCSFKILCIPIQITYTFIDFLIDVLPHLFRLLNEGNSNRRA